MTRQQLAEIVEELDRRLRAVEYGHKDLAHKVATFARGSSGNQYVRVDQAARELGCSQRTVRDYVTCGKLAAFQYRRKSTLRISVESLDRLKAEAKDV